MCMPIAKFWNPSIQGSCVDFKLSWYVNAGSSLLTDFVVLVFPLPVMYQLNLPSRQKLLVLGLFGLGFLYVGFPVCSHVSQDQTESFLC